MGPTELAAELTAVSALQLPISGIDRSEIRLRDRLKAVLACGVVKGATVRLRLHLVVLGPSRGFLGAVMTKKNRGDSHLVQSPAAGKSPSGEPALQ